MSLRHGRCLLLTTVHRSRGVLRRVLVQVSGLGCGGEAAEARPPTSGKMGGAGQSVVGVRMPPAVASPEHYRGLRDVVSLIVLFAFMLSCRQAVCGHASSFLVIVPRAAVGSR